MNVLVIYSSPNDDGLTAACSAAAVEGAREAGAHVEEVRLNDLDVGMCHACNNGWGTCRTAHECQVKDGFQALHAAFLRGGRTDPRYAGLLGRDERVGEGTHRPAAALRSHARRRKLPRWQARDRRRSGGRQRQRHCHVPFKHGTLGTARPREGVGPDHGQALDPRTQAGCYPRSRTVNGSGGITVTMKTPRH